MQIYELGDAKHIVDYRVYRNGECEVVEIRGKMYSPDQTELRLFTQYLYNQQLYNKFEGFDVTRVDNEHVRVLVNKDNIETFMDLVFCTNIVMWPSSEVKGAIICKYGLDKD